MFVDWSWWNCFRRKNSIKQLNYTRLIYIFRAFEKEKVLSYNQINTVQNRRVCVDQVQNSHPWKYKRAPDMGEDGVWF